MTLEEAKRASTAYAPIMHAAYYLDGKLYVLTRYWGGGLYVTRILSAPDAAPNLMMELTRKEELSAKGATLIYQVPNRSTANLIQGVAA